MGEQRAGGHRAATGLGAPAAGARPAGGHGAAAGGEAAGCCGARAPAQLQARHVAARNTKRPCTHLSCTAPSPTRPRFSMSGRRRGAAVAALWRRRSGLWTSWRGRRRGSRCLPPRIGAGGEGLQSPVVAHCSGSGVHGWSRRSTTHPPLPFRSLFVPSAQCPVMCDAPRPHPPLQAGRAP